MEEQSSQVRVMLQGAQALLQLSGAPAATIVPAGSAQAMKDPTKGSQSVKRQQQQLEAAEKAAAAEASAAAKRKADAVRLLRTQMPHESADGNAW